MHLGVGTSLRWQRCRLLPQLGQCVSPFQPCVVSFSLFSPSHIQFTVRFISRIRPAACTVWWFLSSKSLSSSSTSFLCFSRSRCGFRGRSVGFFAEMHSRKLSRAQRTSPLIVRWSMTMKTYEPTVVSYSMVSHSVGLASSITHWMVYGSMFRAGSSAVVDFY